MANTSGNEFFILTPEDFTRALEETAITSATFTPDTTDASLTVTNATNTTPIVITTSTPHGLDTGRQVQIEGVQGNLSANGSFFITKLSSTTFSIVAEAVGAWTSGGTVYPVNSAIGETTSLGEAILEHDALAINSGVVPQPQGQSRAVWVY